MAIKVARGQVTIVDQNDAVSLQCFVTSNHPLTQIYNKDNGSHAPSWSATTPLILTPSLFVSNKGTADQIKTIGNSSTLMPGIKAGSVKWYKNGAVLINGQNSFTIAAATGSYALTVKANHLTPESPQAIFTFEAVYIDSNGLEIPVSANIQFTQHQTAGAVLCAIAYAPDGIIFRNSDVASLRAHCDLWRGATIDDTDVQYSWGIRDSMIFAPTKCSSGYAAGVNTLIFDSIEGIQPGTKITVMGQQLTILSVNEAAKQVTLSTKTIYQIPVGSEVLCLHYDEMLGPGWAKLSAENPRGVSSGYATNEIVITADAVLNFDTFKCAIKDTDMSAGNPTGGQVVCDILSFTDISDPIMVDIVSQKGFIIKNGGNDVDVKAILYRAGEEIDTAGTQYTYAWKLWNSAGTSIAKAYTGKSITVSKSDVTGKAALWCEISS